MLCLQVIHTPPLLRPDSLYNSMLKRQRRACRLQLHAIKKDRVNMLSMEVAYQAYVHMVFFSKRWLFETYKIIKRILQSDTAGETLDPHGMFYHLFFFVSHLFSGAFKKLESKTLIWGTCNETNFISLQRTIQQLKNSIKPKKKKNAFICTGPLFFKSWNKVCNPFYFYNLMYFRGFSECWTKQLF